MYYFIFLRDEKKALEEFEKSRDSKRKIIRKSPHYDLEQVLIKWIQMTGDLKIASASDTEFPAVICIYSH